MRNMVKDRVQQISFVHLLVEFIACKLLRRTGTAVRDSPKYRIVQPKTQTAYKDVDLTKPPRTRSTPRSSSDQTQIQNLPEVK